jgi:hypothetical protein
MDEELRDEELNEEINEEEEPSPKKVKRPLARFFVFLGIVLLMLIFAVTATAYYYENKKSKTREAKQEEAAERSGLPVELADYDLNGWQEFKSDKAKLSFQYPSGWELKNDSQKNISFDLSNEDKFNGTLYIEFDNKYSEIAPFCKYCLDYKGKVVADKITLTDERKYEQDTIPVVPNPIKASGYQIETDRFDLDGRQIKVTLVKYNKCEADEFQKAGEVFRQLIATISVIKE